MTNIPRISTSAAFSGFFQHGYNFIRKTCQAQQLKIFSAQFQREEVLCFYGSDAAALFYDAQKFEWRNALPKRFRQTSIGDGGVRAPDGAAHGQRIEMLMSLVTTERIYALTSFVANCWQQCSNRWQQLPAVILQDQAREVLCRAACMWAGVPLREEEVRQRAADFCAMTDALGALGSRHHSGEKARKRTEAWIMDIVANQRRQGGAPAYSALHAIASFRNAGGQMLDGREAAVDLINLILPIIAISTFIAFAALALHQCPDSAERIQDGDTYYTECFIQEVRRFYPFTPFIGARVREEFMWKGYTFPQGTLVLLDIYGTNHDADRWHHPDQFMPERFYRWEGDRYAYIPYGGGSPLLDHRREGEALTSEVLKTSICHLTRHISYNVPPQDLTVDLTRIPAAPKSGVVIENVAIRGNAATPELVGHSRSTILAYNYEVNRAGAVRQR